MTANGHTWTIGANPREAWALCPAGYAWLSSVGLELYELRAVPMTVLEALMALWRAR